MFIRIKNSNKAGHESVQIPYSKFKHEIAKVLENSGFVGKIERRGKRVRKIMELSLLRKNESPALTNVMLLSKPSRRLYSAYKELRSSRHGGIIVVSTSKGVMSEKEAKKEKLGGQLIAEVW